MSKWRSIATRRVEWTSDPGGVCKQYTCTARIVLTRYGETYRVTARLTTMRGPDVLEGRGATPRAACDCIRDDVISLTTGYGLVFEAMTLNVLRLVAYDGDDAAPDDVPAVTAATPPEAVAGTTPMPRGSEELEP